MIQKRPFLYLLSFLFVLRLATLGLPDLTDPSESRFANAARHMVETGDWLTPKVIELKNGWEPYLAKPPLHIWLTAISFKIFGVSTWSARLVPFLAVSLTVFWITLLTGAFAKEVQRESSLLFASLPATFFLCCSSTTDPLLMMWITGSMTTALFVLVHNKRWWWYLHFVLLGFGFLTKGPIAIILVWAPLFLWMICERSFLLLRTIPWIIGPVLFLAIASPWYIFSEIHNPGFTYYFFIQENIGRYLYKDFGIKFGSTHQKPYGTSIGYFLGILLPWSLGILLLSMRKYRECAGIILKGTPFFRFLGIWAVFPAVFFIFAKQILPTYLYPSIVPAIILIAVFLLRVGTLHIIETCTAAFILLFSLVLMFSSSLSQHISFRGLGEKITQLSNASDPHLRCRHFLFYGKLPQSLYFYHREVLGDFQSADEMHPDTRVSDTCIVLPEKRLDKDIQAQSTIILASFNHWVVVK